MIGSFSVNGTILYFPTKVFSKIYDYFLLIYTNISLLLYLKKKPKNIN